ncbi:MAG: ATP-binding protein [Myxococcota bacterium]
MRRDANGLLMVLATLGIIFAVITLVARREVMQERDQIRVQGIGLANSLSRISLDRLTAPEQHVGILSLIRASQSNSAFAYAAVVSPSGEILDAAYAAEPLFQTTIPVDTSALWVSERLVDLDADARQIREFVAPILEADQVVAHVRVGLVEPSYRALLSASPFHASVALLLFMMVPLSSLWLKREIRPLSEVAKTLETSGAVTHFSNAARSDASPGALPIDDIVYRFRTFCEEMETRTEALSKERIGMLASNKVIAHQKNRVQHLLEALPDAVLALDETGKIIFANPRAETVLGKPNAELVDAVLTVWSPAPELTRLITRHAGIGHSLNRSESVEYTPEDQAHRRFSASIHPVPDGSGVAVVLRDITIEFEARKTQSEFLAHMAHELKAPLNVMSMYSESLLGPDAEDANFRVEACNIISDEIDRLNTLINNIFSIGRIEGGGVSIDRQRVRTRELLEDAFNAVTRDDNDLGLSFELNLPEPMAPIFADKQLFSVALKNLLTNAIKYNRPGGSVSLTAEEVDGGLMLEVKDTGLGIPEEDLDQVFDKFYRSEDESIRKVAGHGLGLALVKEIISLHGGEIRVQSTLQEGSQFSFFFNRNAAIFREDS